MSYGEIIYQITNKKDGFYIDVGAYNGLIGGTDSSQTLFLEQLGWNGICIEGNPKNFESLKKNRKCIVHQAIISNDGLLHDFYETDRGGGSGLTENMPQSQIEVHLPHICGGGIKRQVKTIKLEDLLDLYLIPHNVDFLKIDTEGSDFSIVKSLSFTKYIFDYILIENGWNDMKVVNKWFSEHNYILRKESSHADSLYQRKDLNA